MDTGVTLRRVGIPSNAAHDARPAWLGRVDRASVAAFVVAWSCVAVRIVGALEPAALVALCVVALPVAVGLADLASGLVHWFADRYLDPATPVLGPMLIEPFREHHRDPTAMTRHDFFEVSGNNGLATLPLAALLLAAGLDGGDPLWWKAAGVVALAFSLAIFATNQLHAWAHAGRPPGWVRRLQRRRLVLSPEAHARHHAHGHDRAYCVTTGWLNPLLDRTRAFPRLEAGLARLGLEVSAR